MKIAALVALLSTLAAAGAAGISRAALPLQVPVGWGVDTTESNVREILSLWSAYLADRPDSAHATPCWSHSEQARLESFDLTAPWIYQSADWAHWLHATVVEVSPVVPGDESAYVIRTLFARIDRSSKAIWPMAMVRVDAVREDGRWVLAGTLPRLTRAWRRTTVGPITFVCPNSHRFDRARAAHSARFVDSLAKVFDVPKTRNITYYVADTPEEMARVIGLDFAVPGIEGRSYLHDRLVFTGLPSYGEWYPHELAHIALASLTPVGRSHRLLFEGLATWLGGSHGLDFEGVVREFAGYVREHSDLTLEEVLQPQEGIDRASYAVGAVLIDMAWEKGGAVAVRSLIVSAGSTNEGLLAALQQVLGLSGETLDDAWRDRVSKGAPGRHHSETK